VEAQFPIRIDLTCFVDCDCYAQVGIGRWIIANVRFMNGRRYFGIIPEIATSF